MVALACGAALTLATVTPAAADPAGPTDYQTEVVAIEPAVAGIEVTVIGGDSFLALEAGPGVEVQVAGYRGEPYLWFRPDGTVERNELSPARWLNDDRYGEAELPSEADAEAEPRWEPVADDGSYAWHDHRSHWMNPERPPGSEPGDVVLEAVVPLTVDGTDVAVTVRSTLLERPGPAPALGGVGLAVAVAVAIGVVFRLRLVPWAAAAAVASVAAVVVGAWAYWSVPVETGPSLLLWALPLVGVVAASVAIRLAVRPGFDRSVIPGALVVLAGAELALWGWLRRDALVRALIPSDAPAWLDRMVIAGAATVGVVASVAALATITERRRAPRRAP